jgi:hypothetical protein
MRILQVGNAQIRRFGKARVSTEHKLLHGFIRGNHHVLHFSDRDMASFLAPFGLRDLGVGKMNRKLVETAANFRPDLLLLGHCDLISNKTLAQIEARVPGVKIAYRNVDPLFVPHNVKAIQRRLDSVDAIFITTAGPGLDQFRGRRAAIHYIPNPTDPSIEQLDNSQADTLDIDLFFCGNSDEHTDRKTLIVELKEALEGSELRFHTYGYFGQPSVWGHDYDTVLSRSKMGLNLNRQEDFLYTSARLAQLAGNGVLPFTREDAQLEKLFGKETLVTFSTKEDLLEKILFFGKNDVARKEKASLCRTFYRRHFNSEAVAQYILERTLGAELSRDYIWAEF